MTTPDANEITRRILLEVPRRFPDARLWRRNVGSGYPVQRIQAVIGALRRGDPAQALKILEQTRPIPYGKIGEPDTDGFLKLNGYGVRLGVEVKAGCDKQRPDQADCQRIYEQFGCIYVLAHDVDEAVEGIRKAVERLEVGR